jgi:hypothetical protein
MRRDTSKPEIPWSARVEKDDKDTFLALLPMRGGQSWMINTALEKFLNLCDHDKDAVEEAKRQIHRHMFEDKELSGTLVQFDVRIPNQIYTRFNDHFPMIGATSWFVRTVIKKVNQQLDGFILDERIEAAVRTIFQDENGTE